MDFEPLNRGLCHSFTFFFHRVSSIFKSSSSHIIAWLPELGISNILKGMQLGVMSLMISWPYFSLVRQHVLVERISTINSYSLKKPKWAKPSYLAGHSKALLHPLGITTGWSNKTPKPQGFLSFWMSCGSKGHDTTRERGRANRISGRINWTVEERVP